MIRFTTGNLLDADTEAVINTVNTVGVMGKGIALMFKEAFPANFKAYAVACKRGDITVGRMFVTEGPQLAGGPKWIINFPTKEHWKCNTKIAWIEDGLDDLIRVIRDLGIHSIAVPPLGCGNGGLDWQMVKPLIVERLETLQNVDVVIYEPTTKYENIAKRNGVQELTPARALIAELIRRYWVLGIECTLLEVQKLAWLLERRMQESGFADVLGLKFDANRYGPYSDRLRHLLNELDGSYLRSDVRLADAKPTDVIAFNDAKRDFVDAYLNSESRDYLGVLDEVTKIIDGYESPLGMELLATVDWLLAKGQAEPTVSSIRNALAHWSGGKASGNRKLKLFDDRLITLAINRLAPA